MAVLLGTLASIPLFTPGVNNASWVTSGQLEAETQDVTNTVSKMHIVV